VLASGEGSFLRRGIGKQRLRFAITIHTELTKDAQKRFVAVSYFAILARCRKQRRAAAGPLFCAARVPAVARGCCLWAGPSWLAAMSSGRAGGWSGLRARCADLR